MRLNLKSFLITKPYNGTAYPSLPVRIVFAIVISFWVLNFDDATTGKSITADNYWLGKAKICIGTLLMVEYIYRLHLWCVSRFGKGGNVLKVAFHQFMLGVAFPRLAIWLIFTRWLNLSYLSYTETILKEVSTQSIALVFESLMIINLVFFCCYLYLPQMFMAVRRKNTKDILVFHLQSIEKIPTSEVYCIIHAHGTNILIAQYGIMRKLVSRETLDDLFPTLPENRFEMRECGIFKKGSPTELDTQFYKYASEFYPGRYPM